MSVAGDIWGDGGGAEGAKDIVHSLVSFTKGRLPVVARRLINSGEFRYQPRFLHLSLSHETLSKRDLFFSTLDRLPEEELIHAQIGFFTSQAGSSR